ncbi:MAG: S46 family peptidase [Acidobacteria bacterium]|nr:S46 family peptidase [Acidobacteriota bacterium]
MARILFAVAVLVLPGAALRADEGMWLVNGFPRAAVKAKYGFDVSGEFLDKIRLASVRFNSGGSGSFLSPQGLLFTNHHVGADCIQKLSTPENDYMARGFHARRRDEEKRCPDLEVNVLLAVTSVTEKVNEGISAATPAAQANQKRKANMSRLEQECASRTGRRCDAVSLFAGGQYHLYEYKKYTDVRLVFAPESSVAAFGGDPDNFTYPRYCLDFALFRAYENGAPVKPDHYFPWSRRGVREGDLTFVPGNPGTTGRLATVAEWTYLREVSYPLTIQALKEYERAILGHMAGGGERARQGGELLQDVQNSLKAYTGFLAGLRDPKLQAVKNEEERRLRAAVNDDPRKRLEFGAVWDEIAAAYAEYTPFAARYTLFEPYALRASSMLTLARKILRYAEERAKPDGQRLREYSQAGLPSLEQALYSDAPLYPELETAVLGAFFRLLVDRLGAADPEVRAVLQGRTPEQAADAYVRGTRLADVGERKRLAASARDARNATDTMMELARLLDGPARKYRAIYEDKLQAVMVRSASKVAQARFAIRGDEDYPDATFTFRIAFGPVRGYTDEAGRAVPYATVIGGLFRRATGKDPFALPPSWLSARSRLNHRTPYNFVTTNDTHGGNSGSPTLNTRGEIVGILFDGNLEGLPNRFVYTDSRARSVHVSSEGIAEALRKVYRAREILAELGL